MLGPLVNAVVIVVCALLGYFIAWKIPARFEETLKKAIGLASIYMGIRGAMDNKRILLLIMSLVFGALIGELIDIDKWIGRMGSWAEKRFGMGKGKFAKGFSSTSILFCTGSMAIVGSMQSGLMGNHQILYAKSILDGSISVVFGASLGIGVVFSALPVLVYQGGIALLSMAVRDFLPTEAVNEMSAVGNLLVAAIGFNFIFPGNEKEIKVANLTPAIFIPWLYITAENLIRR
jgi:uncharacterized membrane protein YqgA involved in biofilm formation